MKPQWWVNGKKLAPPAMEAVTKGDLEIIPAVSEREWFRWLENIQDWCISRQLWWGHRVPAYFVEIKGDINDVIFHLLSILYLSLLSEIIQIDGYQEEQIQKLLIKPLLNFQILLLKILHLFKVRLNFNQF